jgi:tryptophan synthase alpha chain
MTMAQPRSANRIDRVFLDARAEGRLGLFPYLTAGYPELDATEPLALATFAAGADGIELGVPFSDPIADGATMQRAGEVALRNGASLAWTLDLAAKLREQADGAIAIMSYFNPIHHFGVERFADQAVAAGVDGVIVPDLPFAEAAGFAATTAAVGLHLIQMVAPTTTPERLQEVGRTARGFVYCVSLLGTTGSRASLSDQLPSFLAGVRQYVKQPLVVGFGISQPEHIRALRSHADAAIIGSAVADLLQRTPPAERATALGHYIAELAAACAPAP